MIAGGAGVLYELHNDGSIWWYIGPACGAGSCPAWVDLDNNPLAVSIGVGGNNLYEVHSDGSLWGWTGAVCDGGLCPGWAELNGSGGVSLYAAVATELVEESSAGEGGLL